MEFLSVIFLLLFFYGGYSAIRDIKKLIKRLINKNSNSQAKSKRVGGESIEDDY